MTFSGRDGHLKKSVRRRRRGIHHRLRAIRRHCATLPRRCGTRVRCSAAPTERCNAVRPEHYNAGR